MTQLASSDRQEPKVEDWEKDFDEEEQINKNVIVSAHEWKLILFVVVKSESFG